MNRSFYLLVAALLSACATERADSSSEDVARDLARADLATAAPEPTASADPTVAPLPFTADQIRAGCAPGTVMVQRITADGVPSMLRTTHFLAGDAERVTFKATTVTEADGQPAGPPQEAESTWAELLDHARFPAEITTRTESTCEVPAGSFDCWLYTVDRSTAEGVQIDRLYFAHELPGPPILFESERDGRVILRLELTEIRGEG